MAFASAVALTPIRLVPRTAVSIATLSSADATHGNRFPCNKKTLFRAKNASGGAITVTVNVTKFRDGLALPDVTFSVPATTGDVIWPGFDKIFEQDDTGEAHITYSAVTSLTVQVIQP